MRQLHRKDSFMKSKKKDYDNLGLFLVIPAMAVIVMVLVIPLFYTLYNSFFNLDYLKMGGFVGLKNYAKIIGDPAIWASLGVTVLITLLATVISMVLGLALALWIDRKTGIVAYLIEMIGLLPWVISIMVGALLWRWILGGDMSLFNFLLRSLGLEAVNVFGSKVASVTVLILTMSWRTIGYSMVMILAGLKGVDGGLLEAARIDGANSWQVLTRIKMPLIKTPLLLSTIVLTMSNFSNNTLPLILTGGGPLDATNVISLELYRLGFSYYKFGEASALSLVVFLINLIFVLCYVRMIKYDL